MIISQTDLEHRFTADVVRQWADDDRDGTADPAVVEAFLEQGIAYVEDKLQTAYPEIIPFDDGNAPVTIQALCCDVAGYWLAGRKQKAAEHYELRFQQAIETLNALLKPNASLTLPDGTVVYSEGSTQAETNGFAWSSTSDTTRTFTDAKLSGFVT